MDKMDKVREFITSIRLPVFFFFPLMKATEHPLSRFLFTKHQLCGSFLDGSSHGRLFFFLVKLRHWMLLLFQKDTNRDMNIHGRELT